MNHVQAMAALKPNTRLTPFELNRRPPGPHDVVIEIHYCGICHSDLHQVQGDWGAGIFPMVPGHEIVGIITATGNKVSRFEKGEKVGVGCFVDSCRTCDSCKQGIEQYCDDGLILTYNGIEKDGVTPTYGGYSKMIVVDEHYVVNLPENLPMSQIAPLLCAGITTYSPLRHWNIREGMRVGIVGMGGLGHVAVKIAHSMGAHVSVFSHSANKKQDSLKFGATEFIESKDIVHYKNHEQPLDFILHTASVHEDLNELIGLLKRDATLVMIGLPRNPPIIHTDELIRWRKNLSGSLIGGIQQTQEMLDFCGQSQIVAEIEQINAQMINQAYSRLENSDVRYRFVIDIKNSMI